HLKATPDGKVTHGKIKGHDVHTHHAKGKVKGVSVGNKAHSKAHKVKGVHKNSTKTHASLERSGDWERVLVLSQTKCHFDLEQVAADLPAAQFVVFVVLLGDHVYCICIPIVYVDLTVVTISDGAPDGYDAGQ